MWPHLDSSELDARLLLIAGYLQDQMGVNIILDLNCGKAPLRKFLDNQFFYIGNDINGEYISSLEKRFPDGLWFRCPDSDLPLMDTDCLMCLGIAYGDGEFQSKTIYDTILRFAEGVEPAVIILEHWEGFGEPLVLERLQGYEVKYAWELSPVNPTTKYARRKMWVLERRS